jgi:hypothetical protein
MLPNSRYIIARWRTATRSSSSLHPGFQKWWGEGGAICITTLCSLSQHYDVMETTDVQQEFKHKSLHWSVEFHVIMFCGLMPSKMSNRTAMRNILTQSKQAVMPVKYSDLLVCLTNNQFLWLEIRANTERRRSLWRHLLHSGTSTSLCEISYPWICVGDIHADTT